GRKSGKLKAISLSRRGDYISGDVMLAPRRAPRINLIAFERRGGPIAGALGYSPDQPFVAAVKSGGIEGSGHMGAVVRSGAFIPLKASGTWGENHARAEGYISFAGSDLLEPWAERLGDQAAFGLAGRKTRGD